MSALPFWERPKGDILVLFDVDGTLTPARREVSPEMLKLLSQLRQKVVIGFVGGSDLVKQQEQLGVGGTDVLQIFDYCFPENGVTAYKMGKLVASESFIQRIGEDKYKLLINFMLRYISELDLPIKRGTFIEFRKSMVNVSPVGRNTTTEERNAYEAFDKAHHTRAVFVQALRDYFPDIGLTYSIGGQISFDVFPNGWDKTYCLQHVENENFKEIHFFGDKAFQGGNDWEIYNDPRTTGHAVKNPEETMKLCRELFLTD